MFPFPLFDKIQMHVNHAYLRCPSLKTLIEYVVNEGL